MSDRSPFSLSKWYLDCVADDGSAFIGYHALLRWRRLAIHYSSALSYRDGSTRVTTSWHAGSAPTMRDGSVRWSCDRLGVEATWTSDSPAIERTLLRSRDGTIEWRCLQPRAVADVTLGDGHRFRGLGYTERLSMTIPPWRVPIDELRWGRFLSNERVLVWIDWRGPSPLTLVFLDGVRVDDAEVADTRISTTSGKIALALDERQILREGNLVDTALAGLSGIRHLFPLQSLQTFERKWRSRGELVDRRGVLATGWAIHEVVRFARSSVDTGSAVRCDVA